MVLKRRKKPYEPFFYSIKTRKITCVYRAPIALTVYTHSCAGWVVESSPQLEFVSKLPFMGGLGKGAKNKDSPWWWPL